MRCLLCPFRTFSSGASLLHMGHHRAPNQTAGAERGAQLTVIKSLCRQDRLHSLFPETTSLFPGASVRNGDYLARIAAAIKRWSEDAPPDVLQQTRTSNEPYLVFVLTECGPQDWLRAKTHSCARVNQNTYITIAFEDLVIGLALVCRGKVGAIINALQLRWSKMRTHPLLFCLGHASRPGLTLSGLRHAWERSPGDTEAPPKRSRRPGSLCC